MRIGLKLWSTNVDDYLYEAERLFERQVYDYLELFVVPGTEGTLEAWTTAHRKTGIPFVIHNAHAAAGFNLADPSAEDRNLKIYHQTRLFADVLEADVVIFHGGMDGSVAETVRQLKALSEPRALLENKPYIPLPNGRGFRNCRGATADEISHVLTETGCGFCLDIGHAFCSACSQGQDGYVYAGELFCRFKPKMIHLSDVSDIGSPYDSHSHLGEGALDFRRLGEHVPLSEQTVSLETRKSWSDRLDDFVEDVMVLRRFYG